MSRPDFRLTAVIASANRPGVLHETVVSLLDQTRPADDILISIADPQHCSEATRAIITVRVVEGPKGLTCQRNTALRNLEAGSEVVIFLDDDVELSPDYFAHAAAFLQEHPEVAAMSGKVIADGSYTNTTYTRENARAMIAKHGSNNHHITERLGLYGCNMIVRASVAKEVGFDDRLKLYALFEDTDFGIRCSARGRVISYHGCVCVHLAEKSGRVSHRRFGFSQVMNSYYLWKKGTFSNKEAMRFMRNVLLGNLKGLVIPYRGRSRSERLTQMSGNIEAMRAIFTSGAMPELIEKVK